MIKSQKNVLNTGTKKPNLMNMFFIIVSIITALLIGQSIALYPAYFKKIPDASMTSSDNVTVDALQVDGHKVKTIFIKGQPSKPLIIYYHGNREVIGHYALDFQKLSKDTGYNVVMIEYAGYGGSSGFPTLANSMKATELWLSKNQHKGKMIVWGKSIGSAHAIEFLSRHHNSISDVIIQAGFSDPGIAITNNGIIRKAVNSILVENYNALSKIKDITTQTKSIRFTFIHPKGDRLFKLDRAKDYYHELQNIGYYANFIEIDGVHSSQNFSMTDIIKGLEVK